MPEMVRFKGWCPPPHMRRGPFSLYRETPSRKLTVSRSRFRNTRHSSPPVPQPRPEALRLPLRRSPGEMSPPFVFPSTLRDLERDTDGDRDEEPSLRPQNPVAVATLRAADLEEFVKGTCHRCPRSTSFRAVCCLVGVVPVPKNY